MHTATTTVVLLTSLAVTFYAASVQEEPINPFNGGGDDPEPYYPDPDDPYNGEMVCHLG